MKPYRILPLVTLLLLALAASSFAIGSGKSDEEKAAEKKKEAVKNYNEGVEYMEEAREIATVGDSAFAYNYRATSSDKAEKKYKKAIDKFKDAVDKDPVMVEAYNNLGYCYRKIGKLEESLKAYKNALKIDDSFAQAREYLGETYLAMGEMAKAEEQLAWLTKAESPYADTLQASINLYKLFWKAGSKSYGADSSAGGSSFFASLPITSE